MAGLLTVAAPCILPLLPVVIGGAAVSGDSKAKKAWLHPLVITLSLAVSIIVFTLLLKATTALLGVPQQVWAFISGGIVLLFGLSLVFPLWWERFMVATRLNVAANNVMGASIQKKGITRDIAIGAALGPVFSSCSPTYALIVAIVLPASFIQGFLYLLSYALGLATVLFGLAYAGQGLVKKLGWVSNPEGSFKKFIGVLFIVVGAVVILGIDKEIQTYVLDKGLYDPIERFEQKLDF